MALGDVRFITRTGGLGILPANDDSTSALVFAIAAPTSYGTAKVKGFTTLKDVESAGITALSVAFGIVHYHASEFFRMSGNPLLFIGFNCSLDVELYTATNGRVKQIGCFTADLANVGGSLTTAANALEAKYAPCSIVVGYKPTGAVDLSTLPDMGAQNAPRVTPIIIGSGGGTGAAVATAYGLAYEPAVGTVLGTIAKAAVNQHIGAVESFRQDAGAENAVIRLVGGTQGDAVTESILTQLDDKQYLIWRRYAGYDGVFIEKDWTSTIDTNDFSRISRVRTMDKAKTLIRKSLLPKLKSQIRFNKDGTIAADVITFFEMLCERPLKNMKIQEEISNFRVYINPNQLITQTGELVIEVGILPTSPAEWITVPIGYEVPNFQ